MKCPKCKGYGYYEKEEDGIIELIKCECQYTNEEWFCSLPTKEKAKFLRQIYRDGRDDYVGEWYEQTEKDFVEWLKEIHE